MRSTKGSVRRGKEARELDKPEWYFSYGTTSVMKSWQPDFVVKKGRYFIGQIKRRTSADAKSAEFRVFVKFILQTVGAKKDAESTRYLVAVLKNLSQGKVPPAETSPSPDPLAAARARGQQYAAREYENPDSLTLFDAKEYAGRSDRAINEERQRGELYALLRKGKSRGFRYPKWQFDAEPSRLHVALRPFVLAGSNCWTIHSFMMRERGDLDGKSPKDIILDDSADIRRVVDVANREIHGEQGAA